MMQLFPYQEKAAEILAVKDRYGLHDEMGLGKTPTIIKACELIVAQRGIVICPAILRSHWQGHFRSFSDMPWRICRGEDIHDFIAWKRGRYNILITSYELITKWAPQIKEQPEILDFVAIDEAHYMKNTSAQRTIAISGPKCDSIGGVTQYALHVWHITGTPMANDPLDIYVFLAMCNAIGGLTSSGFTRRFFHKQTTRYGSRQAPKLEMVEELQTLIRNNSIRRTKNDVGLQLPPIFLTSTVIDGDTQAIADMLREHPGLEIAILAALDQGGLSFLDAQHIATLRRLIGEAKTIPYGHMLAEEIQAGADKRVVFGIHRDALKQLRDFLWSKRIYAVLVNGDTPEKEREQFVSQFQNDPQCWVFIGNMRAAGVGITLHAASDLDIFESDWAPASNAQAIMRVHRIGQTRNVHARFITLARTIDEHVNRVVATKTAAIARIEGTPMHSAPLDVLSECV